MTRTSSSVTSRTMQQSIGQEKARDIGTSGDFGRLRAWDENAQLASTIRSATRLPYATRKELIRPGDQLPIVQVPFHRRLRSVQVGKILSDLEKGVAIQQPLSVNERGGLWLLIDGYHRMESVTQFRRLHLDRTVELEFHVYRDLNEAEMLEVYATISAQASQSPSDTLYTVQDSIPILKRLVSEQSKFPVAVTIYLPDGKQSAVHASDLLSGYLHRYDLGNNSLSHQKRREEWLEYRKWDEADWQWLKTAMEMFVQIFDNPGRDNLFSKGTFLPVYISVAACSLEAGRSWGEIKKEFTRIRRDTRISEMLRSRSGAGIQHDVMDAVLSKMNKGRAVRRFWGPREYQESLKE
jgi:hypothetical protein